MNFRWLGLREYAQVSLLVLGIVTSFLGVQFFSAVTISYAHVWFPGKVEQALARYSLATGMVSVTLVFLFPFVLYLFCFFYLVMRRGD